MIKGKNIPAVNAPSTPTGMGNPAAIAVATFIPWGFLIKTGVLLGIGYYVLNSFKKRFVKQEEVSKFGPANISDSQAKSKADAIHTAMLGYGNGFEIVRENIAGLNYNGWVKLFNAFGNREDSIPGNDDMNLVEWFMDQFDTQELNELRVVLPGVF